MKAFEIQILGQKLKISSDGGEDHIAMLTEYINRKLEELRAGVKNAPLQNLLLIGLLNITEEFFKFRTEQTNKVRDATVRINHLISLIDENL